MVKPTKQPDMIPVFMPRELYESIQEFIQQNPDLFYLTVDQFISDAIKTQYEKSCNILCEG